MQQRRHPPSSLAMTAAACWRWRAMAAATGLVCHSGAALGQTPATSGAADVPTASAAAAPLAGFGGSPGAAPAAPWVFAGLPAQKPPATRYSLETVDGQTVLRVQADAAYGNLLHPLPGARAHTLRWRWRVDRPLAQANLASRAGDDAALKVCALFDMPRSQVPWLERPLLSLAESQLGQALPNATVCYVWEPQRPADSLLPNAHSRRVRYITLPGQAGVWQRVQRDLASDFLRAFGDETRHVPPLLAVAVGADADNTGGSSLGWVADLQHSLAP